jgi:hypothetical protein
MVRYLVLVALLLCAPAFCADPAPPVGWYFQSRPEGAYRSGLDFAIRHGGQSSGYIRSTEAYAKGDAMLIQFVSATKHRGKRVRFSGWTRTLAAEKPGVRLWMRVDGEISKGLACDDMAVRPIMGTTDWQQHAIVLDVDPQATVLNFAVLMEGAGQLWVDDLKLEEVGLDVPVTGGPLPQPTYPSEPENFGFELLPPE